MKRLRYSVLILFPLWLSCPVSSHDKFANIGIREYEQDSLAGCCATVCVAWHIAGCSS